MTVKNLTKFLFILVIFSKLNVTAQKGPILSEPAEKPESSKAIEMFDKMSNSMFFYSNLFNEDKSYKHPYDMPSNYIPEYNEEIIKERLMAMSANSPIEYRYTPDVKAHIDFYLNRRSFVSRLLGLTQLYFPLFEEVLDKYNIPLELKYVTIIESALNPIAKSRAGAGGLWQFMVRTGQIYDLQVGSLVDDRFDPIKATEAAAQHFVDLYKIYGDWALCLAAYNAGSGRINRAIKASRNGSDYWSIQSLLPRETQRYVPGFIAASYIIEYHAEHNIRPLVPTFFDAHIDTISVNAELSFEVISNMLDIPIEEVVLLNPAYTKQIIPAPTAKIYKLRLPKDKILDFVDKELDLYYMTYATKYPQIMNDFITSSGTTINTLYVPFDNLSPNIEEDSVEQQRITLTTIESHSQLLDIIKTQLIPGQASRNTSTTATRNTSASSTNSTTHIVKRGESLGLIANRYGVSLNDLKRWNNISGNTIHPGQKLNINSASTNTTNSSQASTGNITWHTVKSGETLWNIASSHRVSIDKIKSDNNLRSDNISVGQRLKIVK